MSDWSLSNDHSRLRGAGTGMSSSSDYMFNMAAQQASMDMINRARIQQGMPMMDMLGVALNGRMVGQQKPMMRYGMEQLGGMLASQGLFGGGDAGVMMMGMQQVVGGGGFTVGGGSGVTQRLIGAGGITNMFAEQLNGAVEERFFGGTLGSQTHRTHGLNRTDMGTMVNQLQERGAFAGMNLGDISMDSGGKSVVKMSDQTKNRLTEFIEDAASTLGSLRKVFGDQSMDTLMREAERISGMSFRGPESAAAIKGRVENMNTQARMYGMDPRAFAEYDYQTTLATTQAMAQRGGGTPDEYYRVAAAATPAITMNTQAVWQQQQEAANAAAARGQHIETRSREEISNFSAGQVAKINKYERTMLAADFAADNYGLTTEQRTRHEELRKQWSTAGSAEDRQRIREEMRQHILDSTGEDTNLILANSREEDLYRGLTQDTLTRRGEAFMQRDRASSVTSFNRIGKMLNTDASGAELHKLFTTFDASTRGKLYDFMEGGRRDASIDDFLEQNGLSNLGMSSSEIQALMSDPSKLAEMRKVETSVATRRDLQNLGSKMGDRDAMRNFASQFTIDNAFGGAQAKMGIHDLLMQGMGGKIHIDELMLGKYGKEHMSDQMMSFGMSNGGAVLDDKQKADMLRLMGESGVSLSRMMGVGSNEEAFKLMQTQEGMGLFYKGMESNGMVLGAAYDENGNSTGWNVGSKKLRTEGTKNMEEEAGRIREMALLGFGDDEEGYAKYKKELTESSVGLRREAFDNKWGDTLGQRILEKDGQLGKLVNLAMDDTEDAVGASFSNLVKDNAGIFLPALQKEEAKLREQAKGETGTDQQNTLRTADRIKTMRDDLQRSGGNNYIGVLTVDDGRSMALYGGDGGAKEALDRATPA